MTTVQKHADWLFGDNKFSYMYLSNRMHQINREVMSGGVSGIATMANEDRHQLPAVTPNRSS